MFENVVEMGVIIQWWNWFSNKWHFTWNNSCNISLNADWWVADEQEPAPDATTWKICSNTCFNKQMVEMHRLQRTENKIIIKKKSFAL